MRVTLNQAALEAFLRSPQGPVFKEVASYTRRVHNRARQEVGVDSGRLRSSLSHTMNVDGNRVVGRVGSVVAYARFHHDGTGIYGPTGRPIRPKNSSHLVFHPKGSKVLVFATQVKGSKPNPFLVRALVETVPWPVQRTREG